MPSPTSADSARLTQLKKFFDSVLYGRRTVTDVRSANLFLEAICSQSNRSNCLERLVASLPALDALQRSLRFDVSPTFLNGNGQKLFVWLADPTLKSLCNGQLLHRVLALAVEPPTLWDAIIDAQNRGSLQQDAENAFAWLILELLSSSIQGPQGLRDVAQRCTDKKRFISSPVFETRVLGQKIKDLLSITSDVNVTQNDEYRPGGRHDNDFTDFRKIAILPTADELSSTETPFYRRSKDVCEAEPELRMALHLDNQFRLLREDMLGELRTDIQTAQGKGRRKRRTMTLTGLSLHGVDCGTDSKRKPCGLALQLQHDLPGMETLVVVNDRKQFLKKNTKVFQHESFGCLINGSEILAFGFIDRNEDNLARNPPVVTVQITDDVSFGKALLAAKSSDRLQFMQVDTPIFAYKPILECLQSKKEISLAEELFAGPDEIEKASSVKLVAIVRKIENCQGKNLQDVLKTPKPIDLDKSQEQSLLSGLTQTVSLIQGPPGTGKSFIGALIAKVLIDHSSESILVMCYTNHALNQFMEDLMDIGISQDHMVRLGSKTKCTPRTEPLLLYSQSGSFRFNKATYDIMNRLKNEATELEGEISKNLLFYSRVSIGWSDIMDMLEFSDDDARFFDALNTPVSDDGMTLVGRGGRAVEPSYLFDRWKDGHDAGVFRSRVDSMLADVWDMDILTRVTLLEKWKTELLRNHVETIQALVYRYNRVQDQLDDLYRERNRSTLKGKRIIASTTTAAAKYTSELQSVAAGVIMVEEAGEIQESHILTAIGAETKQIVLIGDHKQLRPKVNNYALTVEKGDGYNLNQSMFERLVVSGVKHTSLLTQHRMCPEISSFVRDLTYPELKDAPGTANRPGLRGFQNRLIFFNHTHPEFSATQVAERRDPDLTLSKENIFEVDMVLKCVRYLGQQGYGTEDLVILTPYLGQLHLLRTKLSETNDPVLNDLDTHDLVQAGLLPAGSAAGSKRKIKLSTIDNYQGEESNIVVASLTRSNSDGDIGFMSSPQRVNVLLSRARDGLILLGNANTFMSSRKGSAVWVPLIEKLKKEGRVYDGLPVKCERHPHRKAIVRTPDEFNLVSPDGGCSEPCGILLNCGTHPCPQRCHQLHDHSKMDCKKLIEIRCPKGHKSHQNCYRKSANCRTCERDAQAAAKRLKRDEELEMDRERNQNSYAQQLSDLQDEIAHEKRVIKSLTDQAGHEKTIMQTKQELADLKATRERSQLNSTRAQQNLRQQNSVNRSQGLNIGATKDSPVSAQKSQPTMQADSQNTSLPISSARQEWESEKKLAGASNDALDELMSMIGLEEVKEQFLTIKSKVDLVVRQGTSLNDARFGAALLGNPGTGKTTVARLYARFLSSVGVIPGSHFIETSGSKLASEGVSGCKKQLEAILNAGGGAFFIDEAYQMVSGNSPGGKQVLDFLLAEMENLTGKVLFILAGYNKQMEAFFSHNPGIPSRIPCKFQFQDYEDTQLLQILESRIQKKYQGGMNVEGGPGGLYLRIVARRIGTGRGREGFGNARAVENAFSEITDRQAKRLRMAKKGGLTADVNTFSKEDLIGPEPSGVLKDNKAWAKLQGLIGLESVKNSIKALLSTIQTNYQMELEEKPYIETSLNRVFLGGPGTGKTSTAKLYGQILADIGLLSDGEVIVKNPADFKGNVLGQSEANTKAILESTIGKVLVIDEAYMLYQSSGGVGGVSDPYSGTVIDTIVAEVQSTPGENRCVLLLGYKEQMEEMLQNVNPGLARRFPLSNAFYFEDFNDEELAKIFDLKLRQQGLKATEQARNVALDVLARARNQPHFGNAGEVDILLNRAKESHQLQLSTQNLPYTNLLDARDFDVDFDRGQRAKTNCRALFKDVVGCDIVVAKLEGYQTIVANMRSIGEDPRQGIPFNFLFKGPPGTGKTTTARKMGKVFYDMGFLSKAEVVECSATDLVGQYVGQTGPKTQKLLEGALGKVLFIDEAYRLAGDGFAKEAMDELVDCLTKTKYAQKMVTILAGYDEDINKLMSMNPGLTSRFPETITFTYMSPDHCLALFINLLRRRKKLNITILESMSTGLQEKLMVYFATLRALPAWGNGRDIETLAKTVYGEVLKSPMLSTSQPQLILDAEVIVATFESMIDERKRRGQDAAQGNSDHLHSMQTLPFMPPPVPTQISSQPSTSQSIKQEDIQAPLEMAPEVAQSAETAVRDVGVTDAVWEQLQQDAREAEERIAEQEQLLKKEEALKEAKAVDAAEEAKLAEAPPPEDDEENRRREQERIRREMERRKREAEMNELIRKRKAAEEEKKKEAQAQKKLRDLGVCPVGFRWIKQASGYRCAGGSHYVSNSQLGLN